LALSCLLDLAEVRPDLGTEQPAEQQDRQGRDEDRSMASPLNTSNGTSGTVSEARPSASRRAACLRWITSVVVKIV
jgi:hypothetical protein